MKTIHLVCGLGLLMAAAAAVVRAGPAASQPATQAADSAEAAARRYSDLLKTGHGLDAIKSYWDLDAMFDSMFGDNMKKVSDEDRAQMRISMLVFLQRIYANPKISQTMSTAKFTGFTTNAADADHAVVSFTVEFEKRSVPNALTMERHEGKWRVVDAATNGQGIVGIIRKEYAANAAKITPPQYIRAITSAP